MAERPVFIPLQGSRELVKEAYFDIKWNSGFAAVQKKKNIMALHQAAAQSGYAPLLEISSKSEEKLGQHLSAFHLKVHESGMEEIRLEAAFQGSKVFERGGPFTDLYSAEGKIAKRDSRLQKSGRITGFLFNGFSFPLEPKTIFYDWLYINAIYPHREWLERLYVYAGFTDIEFNPSKSINCQARSCALFVSLMKTDLLHEAVASPQAFIRLISRYEYHPQLRNGNPQKGTKHMEIKQYAVNGKTYTLTLKQNLNGTWEAAGYDPACNEVMRASEKASKRDAQFAAHVTLYELHNIRQDQRSEQDCDKGWIKIDETRPCPHRDPDGNPCPGTQTYRAGRPISAAGTVTASGADTANMKRRAGWECSEDYPEHFDET